MRRCWCSFGPVQAATGRGIRVGQIQSKNNKCSDFSVQKKIGDLACLTAHSRVSSTRFSSLFRSDFCSLLPLSHDYSSHPAERCADPALGHRHGCLSADVLGPLLLLGLLLCLGGGWELQHCCVLTFRKCGKKNLLTVRHFKDIVVDIWLVFILFSEDGGRELALDALTFNMGPTKLDGFVESKLGAGKNTNCRRITYRIVKLFDQFPVAWRNKSMIIACEMVS